MRTLKAVFVNAGHGIGPTGGDDNGAGGIVQERTEVVQIAKEVITEIEKRPEYRGVRIIPIGVTEDLKLTDMTKKIRDTIVAQGLAAVECLVVSIHANAGGGTGIEALFEEGDGESKKLARLLAAYVSLSTTLVNRGVKADTTSNHGRLGILRDVPCTAALIECGFVDNPTDADLLKDETKDDSFALGIVAGLTEYVRSTFAPAVPGIYPDVEAGRWSEDAIRWCKEIGIMTGYPDGTFQPMRPISREEIAVVLHRFAAQP